jgi:type I restriction enzyme S subunit
MGATLNRRQLEKIVIPLPQLQEQGRIAAILDQADALRAKRRQVLDHLDCLTQSIFHEMFGSIRPSTNVESIALKVRTGPFGSQLLHSEFVDSGVAVLGLDNVVSNTFKWTGQRFITEEKYAELKRYTVSAGDVLISIMGTTGRCVVVPDDIPRAINTKHICAITPDVARVHPAYLRASFLWGAASREHLRKWTKGSIMAGLNMAIIKSMPFALAPIQRQLEFAERVDALAARRVHVLASLTRTDELFASLQARAFRGEL